MLQEWELFAAAEHVRKEHGDKAPAFIAERIGALALAGDAAGVATWKAIAARSEALRNATQAD